MISSTAGCTIGLTWGGITAPWDSAKVLVPLVLGLVGLGVFVVYEATLAKYPLVRISLPPISEFYLILLATGTFLYHDKLNQRQRVSNIISIRFLSAQPLMCISYIQTFFSYIMMSAVIC